MMDERFLKKNDDGTVRLCVHCVHLELMRKEACMHPDTAMIDPVTGNTIHPGAMATRVTGPCTLDAVLFESRYDGGGGIERIDVDADDN